MSEIAGNRIIAFLNHGSRVQTEHAKPSNSESELGILTIRILFSQVLYCVVTDSVLFYDLRTVHVAKLEASEANFPIVIEGFGNVEKTQKSIQNRHSKVG